MGILIISQKVSAQVDTSLTGKDTITSSTNSESNYEVNKVQDTSGRVNTTFQKGLLDSIITKNGITGNIFNIFSKDVPLKNFLDTIHITTQPYLTLQQIMKGGVAGLYSLEPSGEPGTAQYMFLRGLSQPLLSPKDVLKAQPTVYINGIPMVSDKGLSYDIQNYDFNPIGPATNLLSTIDVNNIESIRVIKDPSELASLGPLSSNGAIWITTKLAHSGFREISINSYFGIAAKPNVTPINAAWESGFRKPFYDKYGTVQDIINIPTYLKDSSDIDYYGPSDWSDYYYKNTPYHSIDMSLTGGTPRANFRLLLNKTRSVGVADGTNLDRYGANLSINMAPLKWLMISTMVNANRLQRDRNKSIRDRFAETGYIPDLSNPLPPNSIIYNDLYLKYFKTSIDNNKNSTIQGYIAATATLKNLQISSKIIFDYNEGVRQVFWPTTLLDDNNFLSDYFGYNQRFEVVNSANYTFNINKKHKFELEAGQSYLQDNSKYDYIYGYNTANDFIKIYKIDLNKINEGTLPQSGIAPYMFRFSDKEETVLESLYGRLSYKGFNDALKLSALLRYDGSSQYPANTRWLLSPIFSASYNLLHNGLHEQSKLSTLSVSASWGKIGKLPNGDRFSNGPQYVTNLGWSNETNIGSYLGMAGLTRPYTTGWIGYDIPWAYTNKTNIGLNVGILKDRILLNIDLYNNDDKNQLLPVPAPASSGYSYVYKSGLWVNNKGIDATLNLQILKNVNGWNWNWNTNLNKNINKLKALPGGINNLVFNNSKLEVGKSIDSYWVYENEGIYNSISDIPVSTKTGKQIDFNGIAFSAGDANWKDQNGDGTINDDDKVLKGHYLPTLSGGFGSDINYKRLSLNFQFYFALGRKILNQYVSKRFDFINTEAANDINSIKEITFWQKSFDPSKYPLYNPWSNVDPYREDQDLFLQNASFLKLRSVTLSYDITAIKFLKSLAIHDSQIYLSATNLFTVSPFKDADPELSTYNGIYDGYGQPIPKCYTIGIKLNF